MMKAWGYAIIGTIGVGVCERCRNKPAVGKRCLVTR